MASQIEEQATEMAFTGERFMPEVAGQIAFEHLHRYHYAAQFCVGKRVLDVACGEGYGSRIMSLVAASVIGVDISEKAVSHAQSRYSNDTLQFVEASAAKLPLEDASVDVVVSFETIEHHDQHEEMLSEIRRVLLPGGMLVISSPNKQYYSVEPGYSNPYHVKELFREELIALVGRYFSNQQIYSQRVVHGSLLVADGDSRFDSILGTGPDTCEWSSGLSRPLYDLVVASDAPLPTKRSSFFELKVHRLDAATFYGVYLPERVQDAERELLRLRDQTARLEVEIEQLVTGRDVALRDAELRVRQAEESHRVEIEQLMMARDAALRDAELRLRQAEESHRSEIARLCEGRDEMLSSISVLSSLVDEVRRERSEDRLAHVSRLDALRNAFEQSRVELSEASHAQASGFELVKEQLAEVSSAQSSGFEKFKEQLAEVYNLQALTLNQFKGQLIEVQQQLTEAVAREKRVLNLEQLLAESREVVRSQIESGNALRDQLSRAAEQNAFAQQEAQRLQQEVVEQRVISERREKDIELLKESRSWRYTAWLRTLSGSTRGHM